MEKDFKHSGREDLIVINGGANDIGSKRNQINRALIKMTQFMQEYNNTNTVKLVKLTTFIR